MKQLRNRRMRRLEMALALVAIVAVVAACGSSDKASSPSDTKGNSPSGQAPPTADTPTLKRSHIGAGEGKLNVIAWDGYMEPEWVKPFEQQSGCKVNTKVGTTSSDMVSLMADGGGGPERPDAGAGGDGLRGRAHPLPPSDRPSKASALSWSSGTRC